MTMVLRRCTMIAVVVLAGCVAAPPSVLTPAEQADPEMVTVPPLTPLIESPPIEPVEPPLPNPPASDASESVPSAESPAIPPPAVAAPLPQSQPAAAAAVEIREPAEDQQMLTLLADLQHYGAMQPEDLKRELGSATQALARQHTDVNRVRLAVLYTLVRATPQDDQRALQLFDNVAKSAPASSPIRHLAAVLYSQVIERQRAVRDEQKKADAAIQKLEALREMEFSLLRDRVRSGGGGGGGAGGSGR